MRTFPSENCTFAAIFSDETMRRATSYLGTANSGNISELYGI